MAPDWKDGPLVYSAVTDDDGVEKRLRFTPLLSQTSCLQPATRESRVASQQRDPQGKSHAAFLRTEIPELDGHFLGWLQSGGTAALAPPQQPYRRFSRNPKPCCSFQNQAQPKTMQEPLARQHSMRQRLSPQSCFCFRSASRTAILLPRQIHRGRKLRRLFPLDDTNPLPRSTLQPAWWKWRRVFGEP